MSSTRQSWHSSWRSQSLSVSICGAGLGGLTLGLALEKYGIPFRIFERASGLSELGAGITLWSNAIRVLEELGVARAVAAVSKPSEAGVVGLANGKILVEATAEDQELAAESVQLWALHRRELQRALYQALPSDRVHFAAEFRSYRELADGVVADFRGHANVKSSLLVGADGIGSAVRAQLFGASRPRYSGYVCWRAVCAIPPDWSGVAGEFWGNGDRFGVVQLPGARLYWYAVANAAEGSELEQGGPLEPEARKVFLRERFGQYGFDVPSIIAHTDAEAVVFHPIVDRPPARGWSSRSVVLLGDAAHATTPNMGQGAGMALESALILVRCLTRHTNLRAALASYERTRFARTQQITQTSWTLGRLLHAEPLALRLLRDALFRSVPPQVRAKQLAAIVGYDAVSAPLTL